MTRDGKGKGTPPKKKKPSSGLSRRNFLKGAGAGTALTSAMLGTGVVATLPVEAQTGPRLAGPGGVPISLKINGKVHRLSLEPRVTLLDALRNNLEMTAAKKVCDRSSCGACTVLMDNKTVYSCTVLAIDAQGHDIETVEGLGDEAHLTPIQQAFVDNDGQQCGFCTPGLVMACHSLLRSNPNPTPAQVNHGLSGNLCRCGTYVGVRQAVLDAAKKMVKGGKANG